MRWFNADPAGGGPAVWGVAGVDGIRERMLASIDASDAQRFPHVAHRIRYARDIETLWFLRGDLMALLASSHGEAAARGRLAAITGMFEGLVPEGLRARPSLLNSQPGR
jgi:hypothetical protein